MVEAVLLFRWHLDGATRGCVLLSLTALTFTLCACTGVIGEDAFTSDAGVMMDLPSSEQKDPACSSGPDEPLCSGSSGGQMSAMSCPTGQSLCGNACVNTNENQSHCGGCDLACAPGQACAGGACACSNDEALCNEVCTDLKDNVDHCGACNTACGVGQACEAGACVCAGDQTLCGTACVDTTVSDRHCGGCGIVCEAGQRCESGVCKSPAGEDGCGGPALGVSVQQVAVYQSVKVAVMEAGMAVAAAQRKADVIAGREALVRVFVNVNPGFAARELSARFTLREGNKTSTFFAKRNVAKSSEDLDPATTFQIFVPANVIALDSSYSVEIVECGQAAGAMAAPRFPAAGEVTLGARPVGGLKVKLIPILANGRVPDTSAAAVATYKQLLQAMFPVESVEVTVGDQISAPFPIDWPATLDRMRSKRAADAPTADVYYYGLLKPQDSLATFCGNSCTTGIGYVPQSNAVGLRVALGVGFADRVSAEVMAHELGHTLGRNHAPCVRGGSIAGVDAQYPYMNGIIGSTGYDARRRVFLFGDRNTDIMGYCNNKWISDYSYKGVANRLASVNALQSVYVADNQLSRWRVALLDSKGPRWGLPMAEPSLPSGDPVSALILNANGKVIDTVMVYRTEVSDGGGAMVMVPWPKSGWASVQIPGFAALAF